MDTVLTKNTCFTDLSAPLAWNMRSSVVKRVQRYINWHTDWLSQISWCWTGHKPGLNTRQALLQNRRNYSSFLLPEIVQDSKIHNISCQWVLNMACITGGEAWREKLREMTLSGKDFWAFTMGLIYRVVLKVGTDVQNILLSIFGFEIWGTDWFLATFQHDSKHSWPLDTSIPKIGATCSSETSDSNYMNTRYHNLQGQ
jgi:hypothetical protein